MEARYAANQTVTVYQDENGTRSAEKLVQLLWGDMVDLTAEPAGEYAQVKTRIDEGSKRYPGWVLKSDLQTEPLLEVTFVDIGQGDGCLLVMPDVEVPDNKRRAVLIDAGERDNMARYLRYRFWFPSERRPYRFHAGIISHPDSDHYKGFGPIFGLSGVSFENLYHNGLVERKGSLPLGATSASNPELYVDLVDDISNLEKVLAEEARKPGRKLYPDMLRKGLEGGKFGNFTMLSRADGFMPGFTNADDVSIEILGPVVEKDDDGRSGLRDFGSKGKTKNGHSVVLRLTYRHVRMLLGGDLNIPSEELLLRTVTGQQVPDDPAELDAYLKEANSGLGADVMKCCHHGSADFSSLFLRAVNPVATVISSGDDEPHSHPRAETIGAIGKHSRGSRPLIFSTELARSAKDFIRDPGKERADIKRAHTAVLKETDKRKRAALAKTFRKLVDQTIQRTIQVYGAIYVRTDGKDVVIAQKFERSNAGKLWDVYHLHPDSNGQLSFSSAHE